MMYDTVREELQTKVTPGPAPRVAMPERPVPAPVSVRPPVIKERDTAGLVAPKTSPTLVEFQNKNAPLPDWRIQLQNAVKQRKGGEAANAVEAPQLAVSVPTPGPVLVVSPEPAIADPRVASAMRRIEQSQKTFQKPDIKPRKPKTQPPFGVVTPAAGLAMAAAPARSPVVHVQPRLVPPVKEKRVTNKLPLIDDFTPEIEQPTVEIRKPFTDPVIAKVEKIEDIAPQLQFPEATRIEIKAPEQDRPEWPEQDADDIEDLAPFSMRFGAGLFDLIIGGFAAMLALSPLAFSTSEWWTAAGLLTFAGSITVTSFIYMTLCLGFFGKTMGMRLFSLELVDAVENEYPTLRQAAVNSFFFLLTLPLAGAGFLTAFFNEENRAAHDILSGTIMVKEF